MALLAAYNFDELSGDVLDYSGNGRNWTLNNNGVRTADGHTLGGLTKDGPGLPVIISPAIGQTTQRAFGLWVRGAGNAVWWLRWYTSSADTGTWGLYLLGGVLRLRMRKGGSNTEAQVAWTDDGQWHFYVGTYDGTVGRLYIDSVLVATSATVTAPLDSAEQVDCLESTLPTQTVDDLRIADHLPGDAERADWMNTPVGVSPTGEGAAEFQLASSGEGSKLAAGGDGAALTLAAAGVGGAVRAGDEAAALTLDVAGAGHATRPGADTAHLALIDLAMAGSGRKSASGASSATLTVVASGAVGTTRGHAAPLVRRAPGMQPTVRTAPSARGVF